MAGEQQKDIIDEAMAGDNYDYEKNEVIETPKSDDGADTGSEETGALSPDIQQQPSPQQAQQKPDATSLPGLKPQQQRVPQVSPDNPNNFKRVGAQFADGKGNIVDKDGKIIAAAGQAARHWQEASRATAQVSNLTRQLQVLQSEKQQNSELLRTAQEIASLPQRLGVTREEYNDGVTLLANWKKNPVEVAREVVARTIALGHNVTDILGKNAGDALEMRAVSRLVQEATAPMKQQQEAAARNQQAQQQANQAYERFVATHENAELHGGEIASLMSKGRTAEEAYYQVRLFASENGLDFSQPLRPQVEQMLAARQNPTGQQQQRPLPNGGRATSQQQQPHASPDANATDSWDEILRSAMH